MGSFYAEGCPSTEVDGPCEGGLKTPRAMRVNGMSKMNVGQVLFMST
jgi:hypothetical protein